MRHENKVNENKVLYGIKMWNNQEQPKIDTGSTSGIPVAFQCTLDQPVYNGSG